MSTTDTAHGHDGGGWSQDTATAWDLKVTAGPIVRARRLV